MSNRGKKMQKKRSEEAPPLGLNYWMMLKRYWIITTRLLPSCAIMERGKWKNPNFQITCRSQKIAIIYVRKTISEKYPRSMCSQHWITDQNYSQAFQIYIVSIFDIVKFQASSIKTENCFGWTSYIEMKIMYKRWRTFTMGILFFHRCVWTSGTTYQGKLEWCVHQLDLYEKKFRR